MKNFTLFIIICLTGCMSKNNSNHYPKDSVSVAPDSTENIFSDSAEQIADEGNDVGYTLSEDVLITQLPEDSIKVKVNSESILLHGQKYRDMFLFEGDILFDYPDINSKGHAVGVVALNRKWIKNSGFIVIPYDISPDFQKPDRIQTAMNIWTTQLPIKFKAVTKNSSTGRIIEPDYIYFKQIPDGCFVKHIGKSGGEQSISVSIQYGAGNIAHEIGHILGLYHEQSRSDRDKYVNINLNSTGGKVLQYKKAIEVDPNGKPKDIGAYDFRSIMHYPISSYLSLKPPYDKEFPPNSGIPGQRKNLSDGDIKAIKNLYIIP